MGLLQVLKGLLPKTRPEYRAGRKMGEDYAKRDAEEIAQSVHGKPARVEAAIRAKSFDRELREQGKSEEFIKGFHFGYRMACEDLISVYHGA